MKPADQQKMAGDVVPFAIVGEESRSVAMNSTGLGGEDDYDIIKINNITASESLEKKDTAAPAATGKPMSVNDRLSRQLSQSINDELKKKYQMQPE